MFEPKEEVHVTPIDGQFCMVRRISHEFDKIVYTHYESPNSVREIIYINRKSNTKTRIL